jgi:putative oxidoreductase
MIVNHGYSKLANYPTMLQKFKDPTGLLPGSVALAMTVFAEFFCAAFVVLGLFTRLACIPLILLWALPFSWCIMPGMPPDLAVVNWPFFFHWLYRAFIHGPGKN